MRKMLIIASTLLVLGGIIFVIALGIGGWDIRNLGSIKYETKTYEFSEDIKNISIDTDTTDVVFVTTNEDKVKVVCCENIKMASSVTLSDGNLTISEKDNRKWYDYVTCFDFSSPKTTIYIPAGEYGALSVKISTGDVSVSSGLSFESITHDGSTGDVNISANASGLIFVKVGTGDVELKGVEAGEIKVETSTGDIDFENVTVTGDISVTTGSGEGEFSSVTCSNFTRKSGTGDSELENVIVSGKLSLTQSTGEVEFDRCDASEIYVKTSTGDVTGTLLTGKIFDAHSSTGNERVPQSTEGGICEIKTSTGDIKIKIVD